MPSTSGRPPSVSLRGLQYSVLIGIYLIFVVMVARAAKALDIAEEGTTVYQRRASALDSKKSDRI
jgi:hypothetical protein